MVPDDVGGRFSVLSAVGLLPIAVGGTDIAEQAQGLARQIVQIIPVVVAVGHLDVASGVVHVDHRLKQVAFKVLYFTSDIALFLGKSRFFPETRQKLCQRVSAGAGIGWGIWGWSTDSPPTRVYFSFSPITGSAAEAVGTVREQKIARDSKRDIAFFI